jgi:ankyrin repeat protein
VQIIDIIALAGFDVHAVDHGGTTVLHYAAFVGHCDAVEKLIVMIVANRLGVLERSKT